MLAVERERVAREATEHHSNATAETKRLVEEAEQRAAAAEQRAREAHTQADEHRGQAQTEAKALLDRARREAEVLMGTRLGDPSLQAACEAEIVPTLAPIGRERHRSLHQGGGVVGTTLVEQDGAQRPIALGRFRIERQCPA